jgi:predicted MFS family arabinose efflux permease
MTKAPDRLAEAGATPMVTEIEAPPGSPKSWLDSTFSSLKIADYRLLWVLSIWSHTGFFMILTIQGLVAHDLTGNSRSVGIVTFGQGITMLFLTPVAGAIADRVSKRLLVVVTNAAIIPSLALIAVLTFTDRLTIGFLVANAIVVGGMNAFFIPARTAFTGDLVPRQQLGNAIAITQVGLSASRIVGPFVAAGLLAWETLGYGGVFAVVAGSYVLITLMALRLPATEPRGSRRDVLTEIRLGVKHVSENPRLLPLVVGFIAIFALSLPFVVVLPAFTKDVLGAGDQGFGVVIGTMAVGGLLVTLLLAGVVDSPRAYLLLYLSMAGLGGSLVLVGLAPSLVVLMAIALMQGCFSSGFQVVSNALALKQTSPEYYGRVQSLIMLAFSLVNITALPIGWLADEIGERAVLQLLGIGVLSAGALLFVWLMRVNRTSASAVAVEG